MKEENLTDFDKNIILYGPPGTGKTYYSAIYAVAICMPEKYASLNEVQKLPYADVMKEYNRLKNEGRVAFTTFHQSYSYEEFIEGIKPVVEEETGKIGYSVTDGIFKKFCKKAEQAGGVQSAPDTFVYNPIQQEDLTTNDKNYVFIIDEINRGNISKIFGELITLIETTKRKGQNQTEAVSAILPYSGSEFCVPSNVYILGTMNTADRSIALIDTALRRRFQFVEMMPESKVLDSMGVGIISEQGVELDVSRMLDIINKRIEYLFDREHMIGHAFFTELQADPSLQCLGKIFRKRIIPLLQEYFYEDYSKIQLVLGDNLKPDDKYKFVIDFPVEIKDVFNGTPDVDLPEHSYKIQDEAFFRIDSYKYIAKGL